RRVGESNPTPVTDTLVLHHAAVRIGGRQIWQDVDLSVGDNEFVAVLGPNGVGKSTLIKVLLGLVPLTAGRAEVLGAAPGERRSEIGYLPQRRSFDTGLRVRVLDIVGLGFDGYRWVIPWPGS